MKSSFFTICVCLLTLLLGAPYELSSRYDLPSGHKLMSMAKGLNGNHARPMFLSGRSFETDPSLSRLTFVQMLDEFYPLRVEGNSVTFVPQLGGATYAFWLVYLPDGPADSFRNFRPYPDDFLRWCKRGEACEVKPGVGHDFIFVPLKDEYYHLLIERCGSCTKPSGHRNELHIDKLLDLSANGRPPLYLRHDWKPIHSSQTKLR